MAPKIAIVEDDTAIAAMYRMKFEAEGWKVETAANGQRGLELAASFKPDLILLDLMMPEMDGHDMLVALRKTELGKQVKVIILTNLGEEEAPKDFAALGVRSYIVKADKTPREVAELVKRELGE